MLPAVNCAENLKQKKVKAMNSYGKTDIGLKRSSNQDTFSVCKLEGGEILAVVCDGMGGAKAGNVASERASKAVTEFVKKSYRFNMDYNAAEALLNNAIVSANIEVYDYSLNNPELKGMGTTVVAAIVAEDYTVISHLGDSRAYKINDEITQITRDHSVVQSLVESGKLTPEEARVHPRKNVITKALGIEENVIPENSDCSLEKGDILLLCSDGLSNYVEIPVIKEIVRKGPIEEAAEKLINEANRNGGGDNITVALVY